MYVTTAKIPPQPISSYCSPWRLAASWTASVSGEWEGAAKDKRHGAIHDRGI